MIGKLYGIVIIERTTWEMNNVALGGVGGVPTRFFSMRIIVEEYMEKSKNLYVVFMDLEKMYDRGLEGNVGGHETIWSALSPGGGK